MERILVYNLYCGKLLGNMEGSFSNRDFFSQESASYEIKELRSVARGTKAALATDSEHGVHETRFCSE